MCFFFNDFILQFLCFFLSGYNFYQDLNYLVGWLVNWLVALRIYVASAVFQPYRDLEAGDNQSLKFKWRGGESNPGPLAPQATAAPDLKYLINNIILKLGRFF